MAAESYIFGAPGLAGSPQELAERRQAAQQMIANALGRAPRNVGEGLNAIGQALIARQLSDEASAMERQGRAEAARVAAALPGLMGGAPVAAPAAAARTDTVTGSNGAPADLGASGNRPPLASPFRGSESDFVAQMMPHAQRVSQATGLDPRLIIAQSALETGYGRSAPGNNFFGIKSHGQPGGNTLATSEIVNGQPVRTAASFRAYDGMGASADGYGRFLQSNPRYRGVLAAQGLDAQIAAMGASGYATDPNYAAKLRQIAGRIQLPSQAIQATAAPAAPPEDTLEGGAGEAPLQILGGQPGMTSDGAQAMTVPMAPPMDGAGAAPAPSGPGPVPAAAAAANPFDAAFAATGQPGDPALGAALADPARLAALQQQSPVAMPVPTPRPEMTPPASAPVPMARPAAPDALPPTAAAAGPGALPPAARVASALSERDRLMLMRDAGSLAPGEMEALQGAQAAAVPPQAQGTPSNPIEMIARALFGRGGDQPQATPTAASPAVQGVAAAMQGQPQAQGVPQPPAPASPTGAPASPASTAGAQPNAQQRIAALINVASNPWSPPAVAQMAAAVLQRDLAPQAPTVVGRDLVDRTGRVIYRGERDDQWEQVKDAAGNVTGMMNRRTGDVRPIGGQPGQALPLGQSQLERTEAERTAFADRQGYQGDDRRFFIANGRLPTAGEKLTEQQSKDLIYHRRGALALDTFDGPVDRNNPNGPRLSDTLTSRVNSLAAQVPGGNSIVSEPYQRAEQAGRNFLAAILRKDSGAAITNTETDQYGRIFLPQPGDGPTTLSQKAEARRQAVDAIKAGLGTAEVRAIGERAIRESTERGATPRPSGNAVTVRTPAEAQALSPGTRYRTPDGREFVR